MNWSTLFFVLAVILFALDGFRVASDKLNWTPLGFACLTIALFFL